METPTQEVGRRRFVRLPVAVPVVGQTAQPGGRQFQGTVCDISGGGLGLDCPVHLGPGSRVDLVLQTRRAPLRVEGRVVWTAPAGPQIRHGIAFWEPRGPDFATDLFLSESR